MQLINRDNEFAPVTITVYIVPGPTPGNHTMDNRLDSSCTCGATELFKRGRKQGLYLTENILNLHRKYEVSGKLVKVGCN